MAHWGVRLTRAALVLLAWLVAICALPFGAFAQKADKRVALVIGAGTYRHAVKLPNPVNDARDVAKALQQLGFEVIVGIDQDKRAMEADIQRFSRALTDADLAVFFYAGHGMQVAGENYIVPVDAKLEAAADLDFQTIQLRLVMRQMERSAKASIVFLDACRDNPLTRSFAFASRTGGGAGTGLARVDTGIGTFVAFATQPGNVALDGSERNSPFTSALLRHVATPGLDLNSMMIAVRNDVINSTGDKQVPWDQSSLRERVFLAGLGQPGTPTGPTLGQRDNQQPQLKAPPAPAPRPVDDRRDQELVELASKLAEAEAARARVLEEQARQSETRASAERERMRREFELAQQKTAELQLQIALLQQQQQASRTLPLTLSPVTGPAPTLPPPVVYVPPPIPSQPAVTWRRVANHYVEGDGYAKVPRTTFGACESLCRDADHCMAFEFLHKSGECNLYADRRPAKPAAGTDIVYKTVAAAPRPEAPVVAAVRPLVRRAGHYFEGEGYAKRPAASYDACAAMCNGDAGCQAVEFLRREKICNLYADIRTPKPDSNADVGLRR